MKDMPTNTFGGFERRPEYMVISDGWIIIEWPSTDVYGNGRWIEIRWTGSDNRAEPINRINLSGLKALRNAIDSFITMRRGGA